MDVTGDENPMSEPIQKIRDHLGIGYDEVILSQLFAPIIRIPRDREGSNLNKVKLKSNLDQKLNLLTLICETIGINPNMEGMNYDSFKNNYLNEYMESIPKYFVCKEGNEFNIKQFYLYSANCDENYVILIEKLFRLGKLKPEYENKFFNFYLDIINGTGHTVKILEQISEPSIRRSWFDIYKYIRNVEISPYMSKYLKYEEKYIKYKEKYLKLKNNII